MIRKILLSLLLVGVVQIALAQSVTPSPGIKNKVGGSPIDGAGKTGLIHKAPGKYACYDQKGNFITYANSLMHVTPGLRCKGIVPGDFRNKELSRQAKKI